MKPILFFTGCLIIIGLTFYFYFSKHNTMENTKIIFTEKAPKPIGPYSQAVMRGNALFVSGQIALVPSTAELDTSSIENETKQVMENIKGIVEEAGMKMSDVVKSSIFLINMNDFTRMNEVYAKYFPLNPPARETVQVSALPKKVNVEISVIAIK